MLKSNSYTYTQFNYFSAFCLATSVSACFAGSAQAATFSGDLSLSLALPQNIPNVLQIVPEGISTHPPQYPTINGSGTATASFSYPTTTSNTVMGSGTTSGSTDSIAPGIAQDQSAPIIIGFNAYNLTDHDLNINYTASYKYTISTSVSGTGYDQSSAGVRFGSGLNNFYVDDSVTGNESKGPISNDLNFSLTLHPSQFPTGVGFNGFTFGQANTAVPAPSSALSTLAFGAVSAGYLLRRQLKKHKSASGDKSVV